jgi:hypothetical protein
MRPRLLDRRTLTDPARVREQILRGTSNIDAQRAAWRDRFYFAPRAGRRLRQATAKAIGRKLGGHDETGGSA